MSIIGCECDESRYLFSPHKRKEILSVINLLHILRSFSAQEEDLKTSISKDIRAYIDSSMGISNSSNVVGLRRKKLISEGLIIEEINGIMQATCFSRNGKRKNLM